MPRNTTKRTPAKEPTPEAKARATKMREAYGVATKQLREMHRGDFNRLYQAAAKELGEDWTPPPTPEERAAAQIEALYEQYPHLRESPPDPAA